MRAAVLGHVEWMTFGLVDRLPASGEIAHCLDWWEAPAGGGAVAAVQLQRLTGDCTFFTALGGDIVGERAHLELEGMGLRVHVARRPAQSRRGFTFIEASGERTITTLGERLHARADDPLPWDEFERTDCVYVCAADAGALRLARRARVVVATSRVAGLLAEAGVRLDAVVGSSSDPSERFDPADLPELPDVVVRTEGRRGGSFETADGRTGRYQAVEPPDLLVDTYGAGDTFAAGLTFALGRGDDVDAALSVAARCGAWCVAGRGPYGRSLSADDV
ncbi:MAG TPA: PfkB family carbohydrate kinase [Actinomycetota bacterium]|nr:PfkB family carbohydrate kinase [Actinomycetota bacterium]